MRVHRWLLAVGIAAAAITPARCLSTFPSLFIDVAGDGSTQGLLNTTVGVIARVVQTKSGCRVSRRRAGARILRLVLRVNGSLGSEAYHTTFDGQASASIEGGDSMAVLFGAGAFLRAARYTVDGLIPPQAAPLPAPVVPPSPPAPYSPIVPGYWATADNISIVYGDTGPAGNGTTAARLLGLFPTFDECQMACASKHSCSAVSWAGPDFEAPFKLHCYGRHDSTWVPHEAIGITSGRRYVLRPPAPPAPPPPPPPPAPLRPWESRSAPRQPGSFRGVYMAAHYGNFFANAPHAAIRAYLEDVALWGANTLVLIAEPANWANYSSFEPLLDRNARIGAIAQGVGFKVGWIFLNEGFRNDDAQGKFPKATPTFDYSPNMHLVCPCVNLPLCTAAAPNPARCNCVGVRL